MALALFQPTGILRGRHFWCVNGLLRRESESNYSGPAKRVGLARALSKLGYCSRSQAAELIRAGRVRLNGATKRDPEAPVCLPRDRVEVNGLAVESADKVYIMLNKPRGLVTTVSDEKGRDTVYSCLRTQGTLPWLAPVGRLDKASEGLLLLTNDTEWGARVSAPETHLEKTYHVQVNAHADNSLLEKLQNGMQTHDGEILRAKRAQILRKGERNDWLAITLDEGKNRHIRRMLEVLGLDVLRLVRVSIGPLELGTLAKGASRRLTRNEKHVLDSAMRHTKRRGKHQITEHHS
jgi:23S rRNA pseudouridine2605 synthase